MPQRVGIAGADPREVLRGMVSPLRGSDGHY